MKEKFDEKKYKNEYDKEHYSQFKVKFKKEEKKELDELLALHNITKTEFLKKAILDYKEELKMKNYVIITGSEVYEKLSNGNWEYKYSNDNDHKYNLTFYETLEDAIKVFDEIDLKLYKESSTIYADFKEIYEFDTREYKKEDFLNGDVSLMDLDKVREEYIDQQKIS